MELIYSIGITTIGLLVLCPLMSLCFHLIFPFVPIIIKARGFAHFMIPMGGTAVCLQALKAFNLKEPYGVVAGVFLASFVFMRIGRSGLQSNNGGLWHSFNMMALSLHVIGAAILFVSCF